MKPHFRRRQVKPGWSWTCCRDFCIKWESGPEQGLFNLARNLWESLEGILKTINFWVPVPYLVNQNLQQGDQEADFFFFLNSSGNSSGTAGRMTARYGNSCSPHINSVWGRMRYDASAAQPSRRRDIPHSTWRSFHLRNSHSLERNWAQNCLLNGYLFYCFLSFQRIYWDYSKHWHQICFQEKVTSKGECR